MKLLLTTLACSLVLLSSGQIVDKTEQKAKDKTNQRVDKKIDAGIDSGLDAIEGLFKKKKQKKESTEATSSEATAEEQQAMDIFMTSGSAAVSVQDQYNFDHKVTMRSKLFDKHGKESVNQLITMLFSDNSEYFGMEMNSAETGETTIIYDLGNKQMITLINMQGQKIGMAATVDPDQIDDEKTPDEQATIVFTKTGNEKTISGYDCIEYLLEDPESDENMVQKIWMAPDANLNWMEGLSNFGQANGVGPSPTSSLPDSYPEGSLIEMIVEDENGKPTVITTVEEINMNASQTLSTAGYTFMNIGGMMPKD